MDYPYINITMI